MYMIYIIVAWAISNLLGGKSSPEKWELAASAIPSLCQMLIDEDDEEILTDAW